MLRIDRQRADDPRRAGRDVEGNARCRVRCSIARKKRDRKNTRDKRCSRNLPVRRVQAQSVGQFFRTERDGCRAAGREFEIERHASFSRDVCRAREHRWRENRHVHI